MSSFDPIIIDSGIHDWSPYLFLIFLLVAKCLCNYFSVFVEHSHSVVFVIYIYLSELLFNALYLGMHQCQLTGYHPVELVPIGSLNRGCSFWPGPSPTAYPPDGLSAIRLDRVPLRMNNLGSVSRLVVTGTGAYLTVWQSKSKESFHESLSGQKKYPVMLSTLLVIFSNVQNRIFDYLVMRDRHTSRQEHLT
jgi:hypothetical protein